MMETKTETIFDSGTALGTYSLRKQKYIEIDGVRTDIGQPERLAVVPGEFDKVEKFAPELLPVLKAMWTPKIVAAWKAYETDRLKQYGY